MLNFYDYPLYRPPAEANNIIIQATYGCSYNNCSFCSMYVDKKFKVREIEDVYKEIDILASSFPNATKVFLADGDALALDNSYLVKLLKYLSSAFLRLRRVSLYASTQNILKKTHQELELLYQNNLKLIYFGIESGNNTILNKITKGVTQKQMIDSLNKVSKVKIKISATVILGIGGSVYSKEHINDTAFLVNNTTINYLSTLQLGLDDSIKDKFYKNFNDFKVMDDGEIMMEQKSFIELLNPTNKVIFRSNHASNAFHLSGTLPKDKQKILNDINYALGIGEDAFVPKDYRSF